MIIQLFKKVIIVGASLCCFMLTSSDNYVTTDCNGYDKHSDEISYSHMPFVSQYGYASENGFTAHLIEDDDIDEDIMYNNEVILLPLSN